MGPNPACCYKPPRSQLTELVRAYPRDLRTPSNHLDSLPKQSCHLLITPPTGHSSRQAKPQVCREGNHQILTSQVRMISGEFFISWSFKPTILILFSVPFTPLQNPTLFIQKAEMHGGHTESSPNGHNSQSQNLPAQGPGTQSRLPPRLSAPKHLSHLLYRPRHTNRQLDGK